MIKPINSLQTSLLLHELSFILLVLITASVGITWSLSWQKSSEESLRISAMNTAMQNMRGDVYRQLKEVFDASFLQDYDAVEEYQAYTDSVHNYFQQLEMIAVDTDERNSIDKIINSYNAFYQETIKIFDQKSLDSEQRRKLDKAFEKHTLETLESAFSDLSQIMVQKQASIIDSKARWTTRLIWITSIPVLLSVALLLIARRYIKKNVVHPLSELISGAKLISKGSLEHSVIVSGVGELVLLAEAINKMADDLIINRDNLVESKKQAALGELVPLVAHNIRNPLAGIRAAAQVACDDDLPPETRDTLKDIIVAVDRLERWVTSLLSYLHPVEPHISPIVLTEIADNALSLVELQLVDKNISITRKGWDTATSLVSVDINLFEQAIFNLVQNALEASQSGDIITLAYHELGDTVNLVIEDQGRGMTFDPVSEQVIEGETKRLSCGLGIPFAIKIIKQHDGTIEYFPTNRSGTTVVISLKVTG